MASISITDKTHNICSSRLSLKDTYIHTPTCFETISGQRTGRGQEVTSCICRVHEKFNCNTTLLATGGTTEIKRAGTVEHQNSCWSWNFWGDQASLSSLRMRGSAVPSLPLQRGCNSSKINEWKKGILVQESQKKKKTKYGKSRKMTRI